VGIAARGATSSVSCGVQEALEAGRIRLNIAFVVRVARTRKGFFVGRRGQTTILVVVFL